MKISEQQRGRAGVNEAEQESTRRSSNEAAVIAAKKELDKGERCGARDTVDVVVKAEKL